MSLPNTECLGLGKSAVALGPQGCSFMGSGGPQKPGSLEQSKGQRERRQVRSDCTVEDHHGLDPAVVLTHVGVEARQVGPPTAYSPAHDSNLIPETVHDADQGSS